MEKITGIIDNIIYANTSNNYTIMDVDIDGVLISATGTVISASVGETVSLFGEWYEHPVYGKQFKISSVSYSEPVTNEGLFAFLSGSALKGIGEVKASQIIELFGHDTLRIIEEEPHKLTKIKGIGKLTAINIHNEYVSRKEEKLAMEALAELGVSGAVASKLLANYGINAARVVKKNPYKLIEDIYGIGFLRADAIAQKAGIEYNSPLRVAAAITHYLNLIVGRGDSYSLEEDLRINVAKAIGVDHSSVDEALSKLQMQGKLIIENVENKDIVFLPYIYNAEKQSAEKIGELQAQQISISEDEVCEMLNGYEKSFGFTLDKEQKDAVINALQHKVSVITGGPGTGKTTIIKAVNYILRSLGMKYVLCAPTGRAAKRMSVACDEEAKTIHRLLEYTYISEDDLNSGSEPNFARNEDNCLDAVYIIVDEMSMVDISLFSSLLKAVNKNSSLVLVGDADQLPSVGAGNVLNDLIVSGAVETVKLKKIYRQSGKSDIITNSHLINSGELPHFDEDMNGEFVLVKARNQGLIAESILSLIAAKQNGFADLLMNDKMLIISPYKKGAAGTDELNEKIRNLVNPHVNNAEEIKISSTVFRLGDKVMQTKNAYTVKWQNLNTYENGEGVYNGDIGYVSGIDAETKKLYVTMEAEKQVEYSFTEAEALSFAYAVTIHKSQGSEYSHILIALPYMNPQFLSRNLLYTAVTRAKKKVIIVGEERTVAMMVNNVLSKTRRTMLSRRLCSGKNI